MPGIRFKSNIKSFSKEMIKEQNKEIRRVESGLNKAAIALRDVARGLVPVDSGNLRKAIVKITTKYKKVGLPSWEAFGKVSGIEVDLKTNSAEFSNMVQEAIGELPKDKYAITVLVALHYGLMIHEDMEMMHENGQAKFLEIASNRIASELEKYIG